MRIIIKFIFTLVFIVALLFAAVYVAGAHLLSGVLSNSLGVPVKVGKIQLSSHSLGVYDFEIKNPDGFSEKTLAKVPEFSVGFRLKEILDRKIHIETIHLDFNKIVVERNSEGKVNLLQLKPVQDILKGAPDAGEASQPETEEDGKAKAEGPALAVQIDEVIFNLGTAKYVDQASGTGSPVMKEFPLGVENAVLHDITDPKEVVYQIVLKVMQKVGLNALIPDLNQFSVAFKAQAEEGIAKIKEGMGGLLKKFNQS